PYHLTSGKITRKQGRHWLTVGSEGSRRGNLEHSASKPRLARQMGDLAKGGKARKLDNLRS
ncbi:hypothetical protein, partial [Phosphitispora fastidiosa]|uniref:hypothetical protein n=1 Tax=Phosphitispora fastidiosa TaxID=2837202 RepID=UPI001E6435BE